MPRGPVANWKRHQYKKAAMPVYALAASAGSRGKVGKLCPAGCSESDQSAGTGNWILRFPILISSPDPGSGGHESASRRLFEALKARPRIARGKAPGYVVPQYPTSPERVAQWVLWFFRCRLSNLVSAFQASLGNGWNRPWGFTPQAVILRAFSPAQGESGHPFQSGFG